MQVAVRNNSLRWAMQILDQKMAAWLVREIIRTLPPIAFDSANTTIEVTIGAGRMVIWTRDLSNRGWLSQIYLTPNISVVCQRALEMTAVPLGLVMLALGRMPVLVDKGYAGKGYSGIVGDINNLPTLFDWEGRSLYSAPSFNFGMTDLQSFTYPYTMEVISSESKAAIDALLEEPVGEYDLDSIHKRMLSI